MFDITDRILEEVDRHISGDGRLLNRRGGSQLMSNEQTIARISEMPLRSSTDSRKMSANM